MNAEYARPPVEHLALTWPSKVPEERVQREFSCRAEGI